MLTDFKEELLVLQNSAEANFDGIRKLSAGLQSIREQIAAKQGKKQLAKVKGW